MAMAAWLQFYSDMVAKNIDLHKSKKVEIFKRAASEFGGLGDFADLNSFDILNTGIGAEMSVSWTSGGYANASMFSDSYYADMNGSSDYSWYMGEGDSDRNEIEVDESWRQFNDLYSNGTSSSYESDSSNSSSAYASDERYGNS